MDGGHYEIVKNFVLNSKKHYREIQMQKGSRDYLQYKSNYCADRGITEAQYERECFQAKLTKDLKPYPEMINPILPKEERQELIEKYKEHQKHW